MIGRRLQESLRSSDSAARFGGDEFAILLENIGSEGRVMNTCERIMVSLIAPVDIQGTTVEPGASIGIALSGNALRDADGLLRDADVAMYAAKAAGKGTYRVFTPAMQAPVVGRLLLESDLARSRD